ncbi:unnamed protein product [Symbiodinium pilosum]|uniref:DUF1810 domain-containing protein n=1 Tax=Symbiodinium pilosum TaxID=2952 RepID=A0A812XUJ5_SYMPI|nr:unnamed protein product [Symbiodinium pilosum]
MLESDDPFNIRRFADQQRKHFDTALQEVRNGQKKTHWIWYIFPTPPYVRNGEESGSPTNKFYAIRSDEEASAFLSFDEDGICLRKNYVEMVQAVLQQLRMGTVALDLMGEADEPKLRKSLQFFYGVAKQRKDRELQEACEEALLLMGNKGDIAEWHYEVTRKRVARERPGGDMTQLADADDISTLGENDEEQTNTQLRLAIPEADDPGVARPARNARVEGSIVLHDLPDDLGAARSARPARVEGTIIIQEEQPRKLSRTGCGADGNLSSLGAGSYCRICDRASRGCAAMSFLSIATGLVNAWTDIQRMRRQNDHNCIKVVALVTNCLGAFALMLAVSIFHGLCVSEFPLEDADKTFKINLSLGTGGALVASASTINALNVVIHWLVPVPEARWKTTGPVEEDPAPGEWPSVA